MPSGAKKRKAARKKKESEAHLSGSTNSPQGTDNEVKSQDDKDSDVGDVNSPPPQDKEQHENPFSEGTELGQEKDPSVISSFPAEKNSIWGEVIDGLSKDEIKKNTESVNVFKDANGECSSVTLVNWSGIPENSLQEESFNTAPGPVANDDLVTPDSSCYKVAASDIPVQKEVSVVSESPTLIAGKSVAELSELSGQVTEEFPVEKPVMNMKGTPAAGSDQTFKRAEEKAFTPTNVNVKTSSCGVEVKPKRYDSEELPSSHLPAAAPNNTYEYVKDSGIPECSENQPVVAVAPRLVQRTSWLSCCGLFEVLSGV